mmetsp:Transcript_32914/g.45933  ORF Transcript_32914/g.45933 Transcript_32914/m.45933 type:complete len:276 (+) Transcript_32914:55-882(+)
MMAEPLFGAMPGLARNFMPFLVYFMICLVSFVISFYMALKIKPTRPKDTDIIADADLIFSVPMYSGLSILAILGTIEGLEEGWQFHWFGSRGHSRHFVMLYAAINLIHVPITLLKKQNFTYKVLMSSHHAISIICMMVGLLNDRMYFFGAVDGICEISTLILTIFFIFKEGLVGKGPTIDALVTISGVLLWLSYLVFRIFLFPFWLYLYIAEARDHYEETFAAVSHVERYLYPSANVFLFLLSFHWMIKITKGMLKALNIGQNKSGKRTSKVKEQ